jgi:predicted nucleotidyltransferase
MGNREFLHTIVEKNRSELAALCKQYGVRRLVLFGSAVSGEFDEETSDLDFVVEFKPLSASRYADAYFDLKMDLENLLERPVDLVMGSAIENPYFQAEIRRTEQELDAA